MSSNNLELTAFLNEVHKTDGYYWEGNTMTSEVKEMSELEKTLEWFKQAIPEPTIESACVQIGCAYEETGELASTLNDDDAAYEIGYVAKKYKSKSIAYIEAMECLTPENKIQMLDDIVDEIVTRIGIGHNMGFDILGALAEVNRSNFSKFEDGKPVFNEQGKISKGKDYTPPKLDSFI